MSRFTHRKPHDHATRARDIAVEVWRDAEQEFHQRHRDYLRKGQTVQAEAAQRAAVRCRERWMAAMGKDGLDG